MKIRRNLDGKVYQVHDISDDRGPASVLITDPADQPVGQRWILFRYVDIVPDNTPVDVP